MATREDIIAKAIVDALNVRMDEMETRLTQRLDSAGTHTDPAHEQDNRTCERLGDACDRLDSISDRLDNMNNRIDTTILPQLDAIHAMMLRRPLGYD